MNTTDISQLETRLDAETARFDALTIQLLELQAQEEAARAALVAGTGDVAALTGAAAGVAALDSVVQEVAAMIETTRAEIAEENARQQRDEKVEGLANVAVATDAARDELVSAHADFARAIEAGFVRFRDAYDAFAMHRARFGEMARTSGFDAYALTSEIEAKGVPVSGFTGVLLDGVLPDFPRDKFSGAAIEFQTVAFSGAAWNLLLGALAQRSEKARAQARRDLHARFPVLAESGNGTSGTRDVFADARPNWLRGKE